MGLPQHFFIVGVGSSCIEEMDGIVSKACDLRLQKLNISTDITFHKFVAVTYNVIPELLYIVTYIYHHNVNHKNHMITKNDDCHTLLIKVHVCYYGICF